MSYVRWGHDGSHVYVIESVAGVVECVGCGLLETSHTTPTRSGMIAHLAEHRAAGHTVPDWVEPEIQDVIDTEGDVPVPYNVDEAG